MAGCSVCRWWLWCGVRKKVGSRPNVNVGIRRAGRDFRSKRMSDRAVLGGAGLFIEAAVATSGRKSAGIAAVAPGFHSFSAVSSATLARGCTQSGAVATPA
jgi:hypothetical protein